MNDVEIKKMYDGFKTKLVAFPEFHRRMKKMTDKKAMQNEVGKMRTQIRNQRAIDLATGRA